MANHSASGTKIKFDRDEATSNIDSLHKSGSDKERVQAGVKRFRAFQWITFWYAVNVILIHFYFFSFFFMLLSLLAAVAVVVAHLWCCLSAVGFFLLLLVILMIYWMCWHPLLIKIIIHLLNTLRATYGWMHTYLAHSPVHPFARPSIHAFFSSSQHRTHNFDGFYVYILFVSLGKLHSICCFTAAGLLSGLSSIEGTKVSVWAEKNEMHGIFRFHSMAVEWTLTCLLLEDSSTKMWWSCGWVKKKISKDKEK